MQSTLSRHRLSAFLPYLIALVSGVLIHLSMAPYNIWPLSLIGVFALASLICRDITTKATFFLCLCFGAGMYSAGVNWLYVSIHTYGEVPAALAFLFTLGFALFLALIFSGPWLLFSKVASSTKLKLLCFPAFWLINEWIRGWILTGFPWLYLGYGQLSSPLSGWIPIIGVFGTGMVIAASCSVIRYAFLFSNRKNIVISALGLLIIWGLGFGLKQQDWTSDTQTSVPISLIQPDIPLRDKWNPTKTNEILEVLETLSQPLFQPGILIWPEAALPYVGEDAMRYANYLGKNAEESDTAVITGLLTVDNAQGKYLNSIIGVGKADSIYNKQRLVPFGEYVPMEDWLRGTMQFFNLPMSVISKGETDQPPLSFEYLGEAFNIAPIICYEIAYADLVRKLSNDAHILVTLSNDAWFGNSIGPHQHMQIAQARALENQKPLARATNNGVSALVDHKGRIYESIPQFQRTSLSAEIKPRSGSTPYSKMGSLPLLLFALLIIIASLSSLYLGKRSGVKSPRA